MWKMILLVSILISTNICFLTASPAKKQVMLLGVYHFNNRGLDDFNLMVDNYFTKKRQDEMNEVLDALEKFNPAKIYIEKHPKVQARYDSLYSLYNTNVLNVDTLKNGQDEVYQIAFKLAKRLGHHRVYCTNVLNIWFSKYIMEVADSLGMDIMQKEHGDTRKWIQEKQEFITTHSIKENLIDYNSEEAIMLNHNFYNAILPHVLDKNQVEQFKVITKEEDGVIYTGLALEERYIGAELTAEWYRRNIKIYANMLHFTEDSDERIFAVYGQGHIRILQHLFEDNPNFEVVSPLKYLK